MRHLVLFCDKCGKNLENFETIKICFSNENMNYSLELCSDCFKEFCNLKKTFTEGKEKLKGCSDISIANHILEK
jgi:hypothetical protein